MKRTPAEVYQLLLRAGFTAAGAVIMTAIAGAESGWDDTDVGDVELQTSVWGPSYGLFQVRTLKADTGGGGIRDINALAGDDLAQAKAAYAISQGGRDFSQWTDYTNGKYQQFLAQAQSAAGSVGTPTSVLLGAGVTNTGLVPDKKDIRNVVITGLVVLGGLGLVTAGLGHWLGPKVQRATTQVRQTTAKVAKAVI